MKSITSADIIDSAYKARSSGMKPNRALHPIPSSRKEILNTMITSININIEPLGPDAFQKIRTYTAGLTMILPAMVSPANFSHASIYVPTSDKMGIWIEYGAYDDKRSGEFRGQVHYLQGDNGLRFVKMSKRDYRKRYMAGGQMCAFITCKIRNKMTIGKLLHKISENDWSKYGYCLVAQNCQRFVQYAIQILGASRDEFHTRSEEKVFIPFGILDCLQKNDLNSTNDNIRMIEKIPLVGCWFDIGYMLAEDQNKNKT